MSRNDLSVRRRSLLAGSAAALGGSALFGTNTQSALATTQAAGTEPDTADGTIEPLEFWFGDSLTDPDGEPLEDDSLVAVSTEPTASLDIEEDSRTDYNADAAIPLVAIDDQNVEGTVVGMGSSLVRDGTNWEYGNEEFMLNLLDTTTEDADEAKTVLFYEGDYDELRRYDKFRTYANANGYDFVTQNKVEIPDDDEVDNAEINNPVGSSDPNDALIPALLAAEDPAAVIVPSYAETGRTNETALADYVANGGVVIVQHHEEFGNYSKDSLLERLGAGFRFNEALVRDAVHNSRGLAQLLTADFNTDAFSDLFADRAGLNPDDTEYGYVLPVDSYVKDGDTINVTPPGGEQNKEVRLLGFDAAESASNACFERPEEWTGTGHDNEHYIGDEWEQAGGAYVAYANGQSFYKSRVHYPDACSLRGPAGRLPTSQALLGGEATAQQTPNQGENQSQSPAFVGYDGAPPIAAAEDGVVAVGAPLVDDDTLSEPSENVDFLLNVWDRHLAGGATVLYDESHGQSRSLDDHETFLREAPGHYTVETTADLPADLAGADALWLETPTDSFTDTELASLQQFLEAGGVVFAHGTAADEDTTVVERLNEVTDGLETGLRFNADRVVDEDENAGDRTRPETANLPRRRRAGTEANRYDSIRWANNANYNARCGEGYRPDLTHWASLAGTYLENRLTNDDGSMKTVRWVPDPNQTMEDGLGRLLGYIYYDSTDDGSYDRNVCLEIVTEGLGRTYHSAHVLHDEFLAAELNAQAAAKGMWAQHDLESVPERRNRPVDRVFVPQATSVRTAEGPLSARRAPITAESTATQDGDPAVEYGESIPLVGVDESENVAVVGGAMLEECYEIREDGYRNLDLVTDADPFQVNTAAFDHYTFLTNLIDRLASDRQGDAVVVDGGHGQFASPSDQFDAKTAQSAEETAYYKRFLEGIDGTELYGLNDLAANLEGDLLEVQALVISSPMWGYSDAELAAVSEFADGGGAVVLTGSGRAPTAARENLNEVAAAVGTDLRVNDDRILDSEHTVRGIEDLVYTGAIDAAPDLVNPARASDPDRGPPGRSDGGIDDPEEFEISGFSEINVPSVEYPIFGSKTSAVREGEEVRIDVTIEDLNHPADIRLPLGFKTARDWEIIEEGTDVERWDPARQEVFLGEVTPEDVAGDQSVTKQVVAIAGYTAHPESAVGSTNIANILAQEPRYGVSSVLALAPIDGQLARRYVGSRESMYVIPRDA